MLDQILNIDVVRGTFTLPFWAAGAAIVLFLIAFILALRRAGPSATIGALAQVSIVLIVAVAAWMFVNQSGVQDRDTERRALDARALELMTRAMAPGSALACLDAVAGETETMEVACENAVFASAESTASALSYVAARLTLLADSLAYAGRRDPSYELVLTDWRRGLEIDRFGLVAHVLATRDGCSADQCAAFSLLRDASRVSANLKERTFDHHVGRHAAAWGTHSAPSSAAMATPGSNPVAPPSAPGLASTSGPIFPSAASIPRVSIMNAEPTGSTQQGATEPVTNPPTPPRRPPRQPPTPTASPPAATGPAAPPTASTPSSPSSPRAQ
jgi:hypothetical protein